MGVGGGELKTECYRDREGGITESEREREITIRDRHR